MSRDMGDSTAAIVWYVRLDVLLKSMMFADNLPQGHTSQACGPSL
jgi:hypothetical protein